MFYVYKWYNVETNEIFYIGKGCGGRYMNTTERNKYFKDYYEHNKCASEIIEYFDDEQEALKREHELIIQYKALGQCQCNLDDGGKGGLAFIWTPEMREYFSINNPMKNDEQRKRMSENNPMKNPDVAKKVALSKSKKVFYQGEELYISDLVERYQICKQTAWRWASRGYDTKGNPCYYIDEGPKEKPQNKQYQPVFIDEKLFPTLKAAAAYLGVKDSSPLCRALKEGRPYKGHKCRYANQQPSDEASFNSSSKVQRLTGEAEDQ